jgi:hypothetical protein
MGFRATSGGTLARTRFLWFFSLSLGQRKNNHVLSAAEVAESSASSAVIPAWRVWL